MIQNRSDFFRSLFSRAAPSATTSGRNPSAGGQFSHGPLPTQGDENHLCSATALQRSRPSLCHPERSRGICSSTGLSWKSFQDRSHCTVGNCICCLCRTRAALGSHGGFELRRCSVYQSHNFFSYIHAGIVVIALLGRCYAEPNVNYRRHRPREPRAFPTPMR